MPLTHWLLAVAVVTVWGTNFVVIARGLAEIPPFAFATLRFAFAALPWILFLRRPAVPLASLAAVGVLIGAGQFGLLFLAMDGHISPGLASLMLQAQMPLTVLLAALLAGERISGLQLGAMALAASGILLVAAESAGSTSVTPAGIALCVAAAACWALANLIVRRIGRVPVLPLMSWSSLFAVVPLALLSIRFDPPGTFTRVTHHMTVTGALVLAWQVVGNTLFGFGAWNWLLARHPAATVTPAALLVPVFGLGASAALLGEPLPLWKWIAAALVLGGVALNIWVAPRAVPRPQPPRPTRDALQQATRA